MAAFAVSARVGRYRPVLLSVPSGMGLGADGVAGEGFGFAIVATSFLLEKQKVGVRLLSGPENRLSAIMLDYPY